MEYVIFYSWQSDLPNSTNRGFIEKALSEAVREVKTPEHIQVTPVIERDTLHQPGAPDIAQTIFEKIDRAKIFVCDVSLINTQCGRPVPNPNVLIELGYAKKALGPERIVMVMNTAYGAVELLPFDLRSRRVLSYELPKDYDEKSRIRKLLASKLRSQIESILASEGRGQLSPSSVDRVLPTIETQSPSQGARVREFASEILSRLEEIAPDLAKSELVVVQPALLTAIDASLDIVVDFATVCKTISAMNSIDAGMALIEAFSPIADHYNTPRGFSGTFWNHQFDFFRFVGHELFASLFAPLIKERRWSIIKDFLDEGIYIQNTRQGSSGFVTFDYLSQPIELLDRISVERKRVSVHADLLHERHSSGKLAEIIPATEFQDADLFLFLRSIVQAHNDHPASDWLPWSLLYIGSRVPRFLAATSARASAEQLAEVLGAPDVDVLRERLLERLPRLLQSFRRSHGFFPLPGFRIAEIGTR